MGQKTHPRGFRLGIVAPCGVVDSPPQVARAYDPSPCCFSTRTLPSLARQPDCAMVVPPLPGSGTMPAEKKL